MAEQLPSTVLPCPFCGGRNVQAAYRDVEPQGDPWYGGKMATFMECTDCGCTLFDGSFHEGFINPDDARERWNTRAPAQSALDEANAIIEQRNAMCSAYFAEVAELRREVEALRADHAQESRRATMALKESK